MRVYCSVSLEWNEAWDPPRQAGPVYRTIHLTRQRQAAMALFLDRAFVRALRRALLCDANMCTGGRKEGHTQGIVGYTMLGWALLCRLSPRGGHVVCKALVIRDTILPDLLCETKGMQLNGAMLEVSVHYTLWNVNCFFYIWTRVNNASYVYNLPSVAFLKLLQP